MNLISTTLPESTLATIIGCTFSDDRWDLIQENYSQKLVANYVYYKTKLTNFKHGSRPVYEYFKDAKSLSYALAAIGEAVPHKNLAQHVLCGVGTEYDKLIV